MQIGDLQIRVDDQARQIQESTHQKARIQNENAELSRVVSQSISYWIQCSQSCNQSVRQ